MIRYVPIALLLLVAPAMAQDYNRPDIVRGNCNPDGCDDFLIQQKSVVGRSADGTLYRLQIQGFKASRKGREPIGVQTGYAYCSPVRPAVIAERGDQAMAFILGPYSTGKEPREHATFYAMYFAACHGAEAGRDAVKNRVAVARALNYPVNLNYSRMLSLAVPEDILHFDHPYTAPAPVQRYENPMPPMERPMVREYPRIQERSFEDRIGDFLGNLLPPRDVPGGY